jgi:phosphopantothenoylcysteine decarboxylase/phosphopantothenate--cysteine ligase
LSLVENPDILTDIATRRAGRPALVVGFAAETERVVENARDKLERKGCDLIVANSVAESEGTFGGLDNQVAIVSAAGVEPWPRMSKQEVARGLVGVIARMMKGQK